MDPLSLTLAAISIVTAIKDALEVVDQFKEALDKVSGNYEDAKQLMEDIHEILDLMQKAYTEDIEGRQKASSLRESLISLKNELLRVYYECSQLLPPPTGSGKKPRFGLAARFSFNKNSKIKDSIQELKDRLDRCLGLFMLLSNIRTEAAINNIAQTLNPRVLTLARSSALVSQTWSWDAVPDEDLAAVNLRRELRNLERILHKYSARWFDNYPPNLVIPPPKNAWFLQFELASSAAMHRHALSTVMQAQNSIESLSPSWVYAASSSLSYLAHYLPMLEMKNEAVFVNNLMVDLWRAMATIYPSSTAPLHLLVFLVGLAEHFLAAGDTTQSQLHTDEAEIVSRSIYQKDDPVVRVILARHYAVSSGNTKDLSKSRNFAELAERQMDTVLTQASVVDSRQDDLYTHAIILIRLSTILVKSDCLPEASRITQQAWMILQELVKQYPKSHKILNLKATILFQLTGTKLSTLNSPDQNQEYFRQNALVLKSLRIADT